MSDEGTKIRRNVGVLAR